MRSQIAKVRLHLTKLLRLRDKKHKHYLKILQQLRQISQAIEVYEGALDMEGEKNSALHISGSEGPISSGGTDTNTGEPNLSPATDDQKVLDQQPTELQNDSGNIGQPTGSGV